MEYLDFVQNLFYLLLRPGVTAAPTTAALTTGFPFVAGPVTALATATFLSNGIKYSPPSYCTIEYKRKLLQR